MDITLDWDKTALVPVFWETLLPSSLPPFSQLASEDIRQLASSLLDARSARSRPAPEYTDSEDEIRPRPLMDTFPLDAGKAAAAFLSDDEHDLAGAEYVSRAPFSRSVLEDIRQLASSPLDAKSASCRPPPEYTDSEDEIRPRLLADTFPLDALTAAAAFLTDDEEDDPAGPNCVSRDAMVAPDNTDLAATWFSDSDISSLPGPARTPDVPVISEILPLVSSALDANGNNMDLRPAGQQTPAAFQASHSELASLFLKSDESDDDTDSDSSSTSRMSNHGVNQADPTPAGGLGSLPLLVNPPPTSMTNLAALFDSEGEDEGSDEQDVQSSNNAGNTAAAGPYTAQSFGHILDEWLGDL